MAIAVPPSSVTAVWDEVQHRHESDDACDASTFLSLGDQTGPSHVTLSGPLPLAPQGLSKTIVFFQHANLLSSTLSEFCTARTCPIASGPGNMTFLWIDEYGKKVKCSGPLYTDYIMCYIQELLTDEEVFPTKPDASFPMGFTFLVQKIFLYLFHTLAHLYWAHFQEVVALEMYPHLNMVFAHFITFGREFQLLDQGDTQPLEDLISALSIEQNI